MTSRFHEHSADRDLRKVAQSGLAECGGCVADGQGTKASSGKANEASPDTNSDSNFSKIFHSHGACFHAMTVLHGQDLVDLTLTCRVEQH